ncbi:MAG: nucleotidyltransferase family protein [Candidatus Margulisiibacteriota bacterium]
MKTFVRDSLFKAIAAAPSPLHLYGLAQDPRQLKKVVLAAQDLGIGHLLFAKLRPFKAVLELESAYYSVQFRNHFFMAELQSMLKGLSDRAIEAIILKGAQFCTDLYLNPGMRNFNDIDLLIQKKDVESSKEVFTDAGYSVSASKLTRREDIHYIASKPGSGIKYIFEVHWSLLSEDVKFISTQEIWEKRRGSYLCPEHNLLYLLAHLNRHNYHCLKTLCDIDHFLDRYQESLDWEYISRFCKPRLVYYGLRKARDMFGASFPKKVLERTSPPLLDRLAFYVNRKMPYFGKIYNKSMLYSLTDFAGYLTYRSRININGNKEHH